MAADAAVDVLVDSLPHDTVTEVDSPLCPAGLTLCGDRCRDTQIDPTACGACGVECATDQACSAGHCTLRCPAGQDLCARRCVDFQTDTANCGSCGAACAAGQICRSGSCVPDCAAGFVVCGGQCVNTASDRSHCGACGQACAAGQICDAGHCVIECPSPQTLCGTQCVDTTSDRSNCGACGRACQGGEVCSTGVCAASCRTGLTDCGGTCADTANDPAHCGSCEIACAAGANAIAVCSTGGCLQVCASGFADCNARVDDGCESALGSDVSNCGLCGNRCVLPNAAPACAAGVCMVATCTAGFGDCDSRAENGCEVDLRSAAANCGACGTACLYANAAASCVASSCSLGACNAGFGNCDALVSNGCEQDLAASPLNCGACGNTCPSRTNAIGSCTAGSCGITCQAGYGDCDSSQANGCEVALMTDRANCGACGVSCVDGWCDSGTCRRPEVLYRAATTTNMMRIAVDDQYLYWIDQGGGTAGQGSVNRVPIAGGSTVAIATGQNWPMEVISDGVNVWWTSMGTYPAGYTDGRVARMPVVGGSIVTVASGQQDAEGLALDGANVYWTLYATAGAVRSVPHAGGSITNLWSGTNAWTVRADAGYAYWIEGLDMHRVPVTGGAALTYPRPNGQPYDIRVDGTGLYVGTYNGALTRYALNGSSSSALLNSGSLITGLQLDATYVYYVQGGSLFRIPKTGGATMPLVSGLALSTFTAADASYLYFVASNTIYRIHK